MRDPSEKKPESEVIKNEVSGEITVKNFWWWYALIFITIGTFNLQPQEKFDAEKNVCMPVSLTLYTNVGTQVLDKNSKPIPCTISEK